MQRLRDAIANGEVAGVKIHEREDLVKAILKDRQFDNSEKLDLLQFVATDSEILVEGVIPRRFITIRAN